MTKFSADPKNPAIIRPHITTSNTVIIVDDETEDNKKDMDEDHDLPNNREIQQTGVAKQGRFVLVK